jgi:hypothetical protein
VADDPEEKPDGDATAEEATDSSQETAVGHSVVDEPARETAVGHEVVEAGDAEKSAADEGATEVFFSRDEPKTTSPDAELNPQPLPPAEAQPAAAPSTRDSGTSPAGADRVAAESHDQFEQKPELFIAGAFVGAFVIGKLFKKLTGSDD